MVTAAWFSKGKLVTALLPRAANGENLFIARCLAHRQQILGDQILPKAEGLQPVTSLDENDVVRTGDIHMDQTFKAAQKGSKVAETQLEALLERKPNGPKDVIMITDMFPHAGDHCKATRDLAKGKSLDSVYMACAGQGAAKYMAFYKRRLECDPFKDWATGLFKDWATGNLEFTRTDHEGNVMPVRPCRKVPAPSQEQHLAASPGALFRLAGP